MTLEFGAARENMVENQVRTNDVTDFHVQDAMRVVRREALCPPDRLYLAYAEAVVEYAPGLYLMEPRDISKLLQGLRPRGGARALAIAAPYAALVLAEIGLHVTLRLPVGAKTAKTAAAMADAGVAVIEADLVAATEDDPFDVVVTEGAVRRAPDSWSALLRQGGRLGVVERDGPVGRARLYSRGLDHAVSVRTLFDATPPMLPGFAPAPAFQF